MEFHPDTTVLDIREAPTCPSFTCQSGIPFLSISLTRSRDDTIFPVGQRNDLVATKEEILGIVLSGTPRAYLLTSLAAEPVVNDSLGETNLVVVTEPESGSRAYERGPHSFSLAGPAESGGGDMVLFDEEGRGWRVEEEALVLTEDTEQRLPRISRPTWPIGSVVCLIPRHRRLPAVGTAIRRRATGELASGPAQLTGVYSTLRMC